MIHTEKLDGDNFHYKQIMETQTLLLPLTSDVLNPKPWRFSTALSMHVLTEVRISIGSSSHQLEKKCERIKHEDTIS